MNRDLSKIVYSDEHVDKVAQEIPTDKQIEQKVPI